MVRPLEACREWSGKSDRMRGFHIVVEGSPDHWMHLEATADATLADLDALLRETWLESCGHLSDFKIQGERYSTIADMDPEFGPLGWADGFEDDQSMDVLLKDVLREGLGFVHTYDYGTTTECRLRVASENTAARKMRSLEIQARNDPPDYRCDCGRPATWVCARCMWAPDSGWFCEDCLEEHPCGAEMALPVVNSPASACAATAVDRGVGKGSSLECGGSTPLWLFAARA